MNKIPVLVTSFIRPIFLQNVIDIIEKRNDIDLFFVTDGPRNSYDKVKINECLTVLKQSKFKISHENTLIHNHNYGTKLGLIKNIDWFLVKTNLESFWRMIVNPIINFSMCLMTSCRNILNLQST